jgi:ATP synthase protein I
MSDEHPEAPTGQEAVFAQEVAAKAARKLKVMRKGTQGVWFGLGMSGLIGWSVAIPTCLGGMAGLWWDRHHPGRHSLTLALMAAGLVIGCANAWHWIVQEDKAIHDDPEDNGE